MPSLNFPCLVFTTRKWMDDYGANDMRYGDLTESQLKTYFNLSDVSVSVDPYTMTKIPQYIKPTFGIAGPRKLGDKMTKQECARILFDEFRRLRWPFAVYSPYRHLISYMITHMQNGNGSPFRSLHLDAALKENLLTDKTDNSSLLRIKKVLADNIDWENQEYPADKKNEIEKIISFGKLPKFDRWQDNFNGMGITVHDTWATHITIKSLQINNEHYHAVVNYKVQDHFGLDDTDILKFKFHQFHFFRIWFVLQRYNQFGYRPFMTNMEATVEITGERDENKK
ncbi:YPO3983 family protein [Brenneria sp. g21c3]|uniref:YPO3983 family protein n=1 Tax=Brenneria sp. g21c3 TaxID=3093893 RepID=UPI002EC5C329|nr:YPO3983 family protein [Brenneria sp. g21c3]